MSDPFLVKKMRFFFLENRQNSADFSDFLRQLLKNVLETKLQLIQAAQDDVF